MYNDLDYDEYDDWDEYDEEEIDPGIELKYVVNAQTLTFLKGSEPFIVNLEHPNFELIRDILIKNRYVSEEKLNELVYLANVENFIVDKFQESIDLNYLAEGTVTIEYGQVKYNGVPVENTLTDRMLGILRYHGDPLPWILFMENLYKNPSDATRNELYDWMKNCDLPITTDGHFLAYKKVRDDYMDFYTGKMSNFLGDVVSLTGREKVDPVRTNTCSQGLHFCSPTYLSQYHGGAGRVMLVKINPADVVSIPVDYNFAKGRCWKYLVVGETTESEAQTKKWDYVSDMVKPVF